ncbi:hypothetical protein ACFROC_36580, partial [Nocardia tengchongensis]|uniref:hypothetical protein n=1 Tax=Nocardia tengchongensis TaxID=2055889 RepID=UPI00369C514C
CGFRAFDGAFGVGGALHGKITFGTRCRDSLRPPPWLPPAGCPPPGLPTGAPELVGIGLVTLTLVDGLAVVAVEVFESPEEHPVVSATAAATINTAALARFPRRTRPHRSAIADIVPPEFTAAPAPTHPLRDNTSRGRRPPCRH